MKQNYLPEREEFFTDVPEEKVEIVESDADLQVFKAPLQKIRGKVSLESFAVFSEGLSAMLTDGLTKIDPIRFRRVLRRLVEELKKEE